MLLVLYNCNKDEQNIPTSIIMLLPCQTGLTTAQLGFRHSEYISVEFNCFSKTKHFPVVVKENQKSVMNVVKIYLWTQFSMAVGFLTQDPSHIWNTACCIAVLRITWFEKLKVELDTIT